MKEADKKRGLLSDGEPIVAQADKGNAPPVPKYAKKAYDYLEGQANLLLDQMKDSKLQSSMTILRILAIMFKFVDHNFHIY